MADGFDAALILDFWRWDEAVAVLVPVGGLLRVVRRLGDMYPNGFLFVDPVLSKGLLVEFDEHIVGAEIAHIASSVEA